VKGIPKVQRQTLHFWNAIHTQLHRPYFAAMLAAECTTRMEVTSSTQRPSDDPRFPALLEALCCVMAVDGKVSRSERKTITDVLLNLKAPLTPEEIEAAITQFVSKVKASEFSSVVETAIQQLVAHTANQRDKRVYVQSLVMVANADKSAHPQEKRKRPNNC